MKDFIFHNPTKIVFGRNAHEKLGKEAARHGTTALVLIGKGSVRKTGLLDRVLESLHKEQISTVLVEGVKPNTVISKVREAIAVARERRVDMIVAVGGGSVIDSAKAIAAGIPYDGDPWDFFIDKARPASALPLFAVLTLAATASEMNRAAVVTNEETQEKFSFGSPYTFPVASFLDPAVTSTVPPDQSANGGVDAITHLLEPYFNNENPNSAVQDGITEGLIRTIIEATERILEKPDDYDARATMMWSASLALNGLTQAGMGATPFPVHMIEHSLSALYDIAHAAGLAIVLPGWLNSVIESRTARIAKLGRNVFGVDATGDLEAARITVERMKAWFEGIGRPVRLADAGIPAADIPVIAENASRLARVWRMPDYSQAEIERILQRCV